MSGYLKILPSSRNYSGDSFPFRHKWRFHRYANCIIASTSQRREGNDSVVKITSSGDLGM